MSFSGLGISLSALYAQRKALDITGHNVANVNTAGYSRQRVNMVSDAGPLTPAMHARYTGTGAGVRSDSVERLRDQFLELRGHEEHAVQANVEQTKATYARIELALAEPGETGIAAQLADFWAGWDDVANRPDDVAARAQLIERSTTLTATFNQLDGALAALGESSVEQLDTVIDEVNATAVRIADLNATIKTLSASGYAPNDLLDQRDVLVGSLADKVGVTVRADEGGAVDVYLGATALVRGARTEKLSKVTTAGVPEVRWVKDGQPALVTGTAGGLLDAATRIVPDFRTSLRDVADALMSKVNFVHRQGTGLGGSTDVDFFELDGAGRVAVNAALIADSDLIAAGGAGKGALDGSVAKEMAALADDGAASSADVLYRKLVVTLGVAAQTANRRVDIQSAITRQIDAARDAEAGVNLDEEMVNMIQHQHGYEAAARMMTAVDQMLDTLINRTGLVGR